MSFVFLQGQKSILVVMVLNGINPQYLISSILYMNHLSSQKQPSIICVGINFSFFHQVYFKSSFLETLKHKQKHVEDLLRMNMVILPFQIIASFRFLLHGVLPQRTLTS